MIVVVVAVVYGTGTSGATVRSQQNVPWVTPLGRPLGAAPDGDVGSHTEVSAPSQGPHASSFKIIDSETDEEMKMRLYSVDEYEGKAHP